MELIAVVDVYFGLTELKSIQSFTILGSGEVALILDVQRLVQRAQWSSDRERMQLAAG